MSNKDFDNGVLLFKKLRFADAEVAFKKAAKNDPTDYFACGMLGTTLFYEQKLAESIPWLEKALSLYPEPEPDNTYREFASQLRVARDSLR